MINIEQITEVVFALVTKTTTVSISKPNPKAVPNKTKIKNTLLIVPSVLKAISSKWLSFFPPLSINTTCAIAKAAVNDNAIKLRMVFFDLFNIT